MSSVEPVTINLRYLGGLPDQLGPVETLDVTFDETSIRTGRYYRYDADRGPVRLEGFDVPWSDVRALRVEGPDQVQQRFGGLVAFGGLGLVWHRKEKAAYLVVEVVGGSEGIFATEKLTIFELRARLASFLSRFAAPAQAGGASPTIEYLQKLADLHAAGVLTDEEFAAAKARLLGG